MAQRRTAGRRKRAHQAGDRHSVSTLTRRSARSRDRQMAPPERTSPGEDVAAELKRLRRENEILRQERDILKSDGCRQQGQSVRFQLIDAAKKEFPVQRRCKELGVSESGYGRAD